MSDNPLSTETASSIVNRAKAIIMTPKLEWPRIAAEGKSPAQILTSYALWLAAIGPVAALIGGQIFGQGFFGFSYHPPIGAAVLQLITSYVAAIVGLFVYGFIANFLSPKFGGKDDFASAFRLAAYAMTPSWVAGIFGLISGLSILVLLAMIYNIYLFLVGATPVMGVPEDKAPAYTAVTIAAAIVLGLVVGLVLMPLVAVNTVTVYN